MPRGPAAERLLTQRRVEHQGDDLAWSVSGIMLVFSLLLALHVATLSLQRDIDAWADQAIAPYGFIYSNDPAVSALDQPLEDLRPDIAVARFSTHTPWPSSVHAVAGAELARVVETTGDADALAIARRLGPGKIILSKMMARRFHVHTGDTMQVSGKGGAARLEIVGVTDAVGYTPAGGPYRNGKTYAVIDAADFPLIAPYTKPIGASLLLAGTSGERTFWGQVFHRMRITPGVYAEGGPLMKELRKEDTARDFVIFDLILGLTTLLAGVGVTNQMILAVHARRREIGLYRVLGMTTKQVRRMVLMEGVFVGAVGGGLAALLGAALGQAAIGALKAVSAFDLEYLLPYRFLAFTWLGGVAVALLASIHPALRAGRSDAAESVHYE